jgi:RimJ/RimL family protein N-acetyltransferase
LRISCGGGAGGTARPDGSRVLRALPGAEARGRGVGQAALEALEAWARQAGFRQIGLHVFGSNATARRLYARIGYVEVNVTMQKDL